MVLRGSVPQLVHYMPLEVERQVFFAPLFEYLREIPEKTEQMSLFDI